MRPEAAAHRERLRAEVERRGLDGALVYSWERGAVAWFTGYFPGFRTNHATLWLPAAGEPVLGTRHPYEHQRAARDSGLPSVGGVKPIDLVPPQARRIGLVAGDLAIDETPPELLRALRERGVEVVDLSAVADRWRAAKSPAEVAALTRAAEIGLAGLAAARRGVQPDEFDFAIAARAEESARRQGAQRALCLIGIGDGAVVTEASGVRAGSGQPICLEFTLAVDGFWMQVNDTLLPPGAPAHAHRAITACRQTRQAIIAALQPGAPVDEVVAAGDAVLAARGLLSYKEYDFGHGVGADSPEYPWLIAGTGRVVEEGAVVAVHVALRRPGGETAFIGGPVVVRKDGSHELLPQATWAGLE